MKIPYNSSLVNPGLLPEDRKTLTYRDALWRLKEASKNSFIGGYEMPDEPVEGNRTLKDIRDKHIQDLKSTIKRRENYKTKFGKHIFNGSIAGLAVGGLYIVYSSLQLQNMISSGAGAEAYTQSLPCLSEIFYNVAGNLPVLEKSHHYVDCLLNIPEIAEYYCNTYLHAFDFSGYNPAEEIKNNLPQSYNTDFRMLMRSEEFLANIPLSAITGAVVGAIVGVGAKASNVLDKIFLHTKRTEVEALKKIQFTEPEE